VDWGAVDTMLSSIAPEVTGISQHFQKGVIDVTGSKQQLINRQPAGYGPNICI